MTCGVRRRTIGYYGGDAPATNWLTGIIDGSDDAIVSKNLNGIIQSWNDGATRLFGYSADEAIGKPLAILPPEDRLHEEPTIQAQIWRSRLSVAANGDQVRLVWRETGGPVPSAGLSGFGSRLERSVMVALNAMIERDWRLTGLVATITIPKRILIA